MTKTTHKAIPPDQSSRDAILTNLDTNLLVEAAAGTGKTTSLIGRITELIRHKKCAIERLAAVTFTRKAAAELRARCQVQFETLVRNETDPVHKRYFEEALSHIDQCFIGTIHSFCARLLRERPVEAGVGLSFRELEPNEDRLIREESWDEYLAALYAGNGAIIRELQDCGIHPGQLKTAFVTLADYPDIQDWPAPATELPDLEPIIAELRKKLEHIQALAPTLPFDAGTDKLIPAYKRIARLARHTDLNRLVELMELLELCKEYKVTQKMWPGGRDQAIQEQEEWMAFVNKFVKPLQTKWYARRYHVALRFLRPATQWYESKKERMGVLNFQDLLLKAARLLREHPSVRRYLQKRYTHLMVDEFQDTDPIQAEVMMLLTSTDVNEKDWTKCVPAPGSLFVVGDPKQSIYRFRRADIVTYNRVKTIIEQTHGTVVHLSTSFRTDPPVIEWVNRHFTTQFPKKADSYSPEYIALRTIAPRDLLSSSKVYRLAVPADFEKRDDCIAYEADWIARYIRGQLNDKKAVPEDFMIVTTKTGDLSLYSAQLHRYGIPNQVTGGNTLNQLPELELLVLCLRATIQSHNPVALVSVLRSELFGISDELLFEFHQRQGRFNIHVPAPESFEARQTIQAIFDKLKQYSNWLNRLPLISAVEKIAYDLGLIPHACIQPLADLRAGSLLKVFELMRDMRNELTTQRDMLDFLESILEQSEAYDGMTATPPTRSAVQIMNLHKVKGLEARIVFLACPAGEFDHGVVFHIDRSGAQTKGYIPIFEPRRLGRAKCLAKPEEWEKWELEENRFLRNESIRLMYVAATRAKQQLIISQREKGNHLNPWKTFLPSLTDCPILEAPVSVHYNPESKRPFDAERQKAVYQHPTFIETVSAPTYRVKRGKETAQRPSPAMLQGVEYGTEWGEIVHCLLKSKMEDPSADLSNLTANLLEEKQMDLSLRSDMLQTVEIIAASDIFNRARRAERCLVEAPFIVRLESNNTGTDSLPTIVRGIIDLVFYERNGWVIVDYKTDAAALHHSDTLLEMYRPQLETYAREWSKITGEPVHETGIYFTAIQQYQCYVN